MLKQKLLKCKAGGDQGKLSSAPQSREAIAAGVVWVPIRQKTEEEEDGGSCTLRHISQDCPGYFAVSFKRFGLFGADRDCPTTFVVCCLVALVQLFCLFYLIFRGLL